MSIVPAPILTKIANVRAHHGKIVFVSGVFDILHQEHQAFLKKAAELGDLVVIGIESDLRVKQLKGPDRPINPAAKRVAQLEALHLSAAIFVLPEQFSKPADHDHLISLIKPDFLAVSSHTAHLDKKAAIVEKYGGQLKVVLEQNPTVSTTLILAGNLPIGDDK